MAYTINYNYPCRGTNYTAGRDGNKVRYIVVHYTASQASAKNNAIYFNRDKVAASAHYFIDGNGTIYASVPENSTAWACGNFAYNQKSVSIEVVSDGRDFTEAEIKELTWLTQTLMKKYNVPASCVIRHYDCVGKHCPLPYINNAKWNALRARITRDKVSTGTTNSGGSSSSSSAPTLNPNAALSVDGYLGSNTVAKLQSQLGTPVDGVVSGQYSGNKQYLLRCVAGAWVFSSSASGSPMIKALQKKIGADADGIMGRDSVLALQRFLGVAADGYLGEATAKALQTALNNNKFRGGAAAPAPSKPASPAISVGVDGYWGSGTTTALQKYLGCKIVDGVVSNQYHGNKKYCTNCTTGWEWKHSGYSAGSTVIKELQKRLGVAADGLIGPSTNKALQKKLGVGQDGICGPTTVSRLQEAINKKTL